MKVKIDILLIIILGLLTGCSGSTITSSNPMEITSSTSLPDSAFTQTPSPYTTVMPEITSLPSLQPNNVKEILSSFVRNNGGCKLPCLMGITPGEAYKSVESFGTYFISNTQQSNDQINTVDIVGHLDDIGGGTLLAFWDNRIRVQIGIGAYPTPGKGQIGYVTLSASVYEHFRDNNGLEAARLLRQHSYYDNLLSSFSLPAILTEYGQPTEIWIFPFPEYPGYSYEDSTYPFVFVLVYTDTGFAVEYISLVKDEGEYLVGCPDVDYIGISTWNPVLKKTINDIAQYFSGTDSLSKSNVQFFKPLQDATSLTNKDFYEIYKAGNTEGQCIETPRSLWP